ncbi:hypothetical protein [Streptomyces sp. CRN 30]|uniref:hypothetical protein n=1 Tax=Streptomyces sp. CRN 30 TaxID=3075613 RepID=UPI002A7F00D3|nr:hypothetical protein [Streptomyces sp. CRN 30]
MPQPPSWAPTPASPTSSVSPFASEATRLLCAGTYLDSAYRDRVIEELHLNRQRIVAPSLGLDAARVLAHALRARRLEVGWASAIVGLWVVGLPLTDRLLAGYLLPSLLLAAGVAVRGKEERPSLARRFVALVFRWYGRSVFTVFLAATVLVAFSGTDDPLTTSDGRSGIEDVLRITLPLASGLAGGDGEVTALQAWLALLLFLAVALCAGAQRSQFARALAGELSPQRFPDVRSDPAEENEGRRFQYVRDRIRREQHEPLIMYHEARPFCGAGLDYDTWVFAVEMRPSDGKRSRPLSNRVVLDTVRPLLEKLRLPSEYAGHTVRDRLRWLEIDECVFLPAEGLSRRADAPYDRSSFETHRVHAVEEGAEKRRHFLRVRVGGWEEELVVTVFVRIHTQGRMLMLEIAPHVLMPVRADFQEADRTAYRFRSNNALGKISWATARVPASAVRSLVTVCQAAAYGWQLLTGGYDKALPEGPALSVRELGSARTGSLFQHMDVDRYLRSVQERIARGVRIALSEHGYETGEFVQKIINNGHIGTRFGNVSHSTFAMGDHARASSSVQADGPRPPEGNPRP